MNFIEDIREIYQYRQLLGSLVARHLKERYRGSVLGFLWTLMSPLLLMLVYSLVFSVYVRIEMKDYAIFLFCGLLPWLWFAQALTEGTNSIVMGGSLVTKSMFPAKILPTVCVLAAGFNYLVSLPILAIFLLVAGIHVHPTVWVVVPMALLIQFIFTEGLVLMASALNVFYRDIQHLLANLITLWFFVTPILYPENMVPRKFNWLVAINPMAPIVGVYQDVFFYGKLPNGVELLQSVGVSVLVLMVGLWIFDKHKDRFAEIL
jgi:ABC-type polysaccharide/polyol phosphate export permease